GFEFNIDERKLVFSPGDATELKKAQSTPMNFINKYVGEDGLMKDVVGYHKALAIAMNPDKFAKFFYEQDRKKSLLERTPLLSKVVYHNKLGTQLERTERVGKIAQSIATELKKNNPAISVELAERAAKIAKADLLTDMVGEFPELQGIMGRYYALNDKEHPDVAAACMEHYSPKFAGDALPNTDTGTILALADKLETLVGIWGIGLAPTGEKDPFALRRHALGICRILLEKKLPLNVCNL
ncbi:MAG: glycine--tRNA ligase subunit beta, partial [Polynucleobacter victoriensis]